MILNELPTEILVIACFHNLIQWDLVHIDATDSVNYRLANYQKIYENAG